VLGFSVYGVLEFVMMLTLSVRAPMESDREGVESDREEVERA
jgi:hypothetical protein